MSDKISTPPFVQIVGSGAIGSLIAAGAEKSSVSYGLAPRNRHKITRTVKLMTGENLLLNHDQGERNQLGDEDILVLPLKAYQLREAASLWQFRLGPSTPVILLHNGMGGYEQVRKYFTDQPLFLGTTSHGAMRISATEVCHTGQGKTVIGPAPGVSVPAAQRHRLHAVITACLPSVEWRDNIVLALWEKLAVNAVINPLTALNDVPNGGLARPEYREQIVGLCHEVASVMRACGHPADEENLLQNVLLVIRATAGNYSSMHQDMLNHRPTEIEAINGYIIKQAQKKGIEVPFNTLLYHSVCQRLKERPL